MSDVLNLLAELDQDSHPKRPTSSSKGGKKGKGALPSRQLSQRSSRSASRAARPQSLPPSKPQTLRLPTSTSQAAEPNLELVPSHGQDGRRISFADHSRPPVRRLWVPTKSDSLASGFLYDHRLRKYGVSEEEWDHFSREIVEAADISGPSWLWTFKRKEVIQKMKKDLQYDSNLKSVLKKWNKLFKRQRFQAWIELPTPKGHRTPGSEAIGDSKEEQAQSNRDAKRFKVVISPENERPASVYSRASSMTRSLDMEDRLFKTKTK